MTQLLTIPALSIVLSVVIFAADPSGTSREVQYKKTDIVPMATAIRFTTLIELPEAGDDLGGDLRRQRILGR